METTTHGWTVLDRDAGVLSRTYEFNDKRGTCNTFAVQLPDGSMLVMSPSAGTPEAAWEELAEFGDVSTMVTPNGFHHLGQKEWRARYPNADNFASPEAAARIAKQNPDVPGFRPISEVQDRLGESIKLREAPAAL